MKITDVKFDSNDGKVWLKTDLLEIDKNKVRMLEVAEMMLDALEVLEFHSGYPLMMNDPMRVYARKAIAKARGEK